MMLRSWSRPIFAGLVSSRLSLLDLDLVMNLRLGCFEERYCLESGESSIKKFAFHLFVCARTIKKVRVRALAPVLPLARNLGV